MPEGGTTNLGSAIPTHPRSPTKGRWKRSPCSEQPAYRQKKVYRGFRSSAYAATRESLSGLRTGTESLHPIGRQSKQPAHAQGPQKQTPVEGPAPTKKKGNTKWTSPVLLQKFVHIQTHKSPLLKGFKWWRRRRLTRTHPLCC